ncbi:MAG: zinc ribbon domain-containing protein [Planctomycetota bacterium]|nr:zinc ribbon domain-containing protein [Planctomycetota bacterium]
MPTYEYECAACGHEFERFESIKAEPNHTCPKCSKKKAQRRISGGCGLIFKGSGFYCTDYKRSSRSASSSKNESKPSGAKPECSSCETGAKTGCPAAGKS